MTSDARLHFNDLLPCERLGSDAWIQAVAQAIPPRRRDRNKFVFRTGRKSENSRAGACLKGQSVHALALARSWKEDKDERCCDGKAHLILQREVRTRSKLIAYRGFESQPVREEVVIPFHLESAHRRQGVV
jgi:hypothetical protein